jgi:hypothetical protein
MFRCGPWLREKRFGRGSGAHEVHLNNGETRSILPFVLLRA